jgi:Rrf2 family transcriptional regulator, cysteine metabolism repressor
MIYMARHREASWITIKELAKQENYPVAYIEKILQSLRQAKLVLSHQGTQGGYVLAKEASEITLRQIVDALEGATFDVFCNPSVREDIVCNHICLCGAKSIWKKTKELLDHFYESISLEDLSKNPAEVQHLVQDVIPAQAGIESDPRFRGDDIRTGGGDDIRVGEGYER